MSFHLIFGHFLQLFVHCETVPKSLVPLASRAFHPLVVFWKFPCAPTCSMPSHRQSMLLARCNPGIVYGRWTLWNPLGLKCFFFSPWVYPYSDQFLNEDVASGGDYKASNSIARVPRELPLGAQPCKQIVLLNNMKFCQSCLFPLFFSLVFGPLLWIEWGFALCQPLGENK